MIEKINRWTYGKTWPFAHVLKSTILFLTYFAVMLILQMEVSSILSIINKDTISLSAAIAGFVFAGMSIFISMSENAKMKTVTSIGQAHIIYGILVCSVVSFVLSLLMMGSVLTIFNIDPMKITLSQKIVKIVLEWGSVYSIISGFVFFFSSLKLMYGILK